MLSLASVNSRMLWPWLLAVRDLNADPELELARLGLSEAQLRDPGERIPHDTTQALVAGLVSLTGRRDLGLVAARAVEAGHFELLELAARSASTMGQAIDSIVRFFSPVDSGGALTTRPGARHFHLGYRTTCDHPPHPAYVEYVAAMLLLAARRETGTDVLAPRSVHFRHRGPADPGPYTGVFGCPVSFHAEETVALIDLDDMALPMVRANRRTHDGAIAAICDWFRQTGS